MNRITVSRLDQARIRKSINDAKLMKSISATEAETLLRELDNAIILDPKDIPSDVVTMNSVVKIRFDNGDKTLQFKIVYPGQANVRENRISIFSPVATAIIGYKVGDEIEWIVPAGLTRFRIEEILYQPEAAGDYDQ